MKKTLFTFIAVTLVAGLAPVHQANAYTVAQLAAGYKLATGKNGHHTLRADGERCRDIGYWLDGSGCHGVKKPKQRPSNATLVAQNQRCHLDGRWLNYTLCRPVR